MYMMEVDRVLRPRIIGYYQVLPSMEEILPNMEKYPNMVKRKNKI
jgi:hypothetical protein